jgi:hypothetical protein
MSMQVRTASVAARRGAVVAVALVGALGSPGTFGANIVDNSAGPAVDANIHCTSLLNPAPVTALAAGGASAMGQRATLLAQFAGIPGGQVVLGAAAPGTFTIDSYFAWVRGQVGGAHLTCRYDDGDGVPDWMLPGGGNPSYRWVQEINTNKPLGGAGSPYIDPRPGDDVKQGATFQLPYYWTDPEAIKRFTNGVNYDLLMRDTPRRPCDQFVTWRSDLFIVTENNFTYPQADPTHVITIHDGFRWGFDLIPTLAKYYHLVVTDVIESTTTVPLIWGEGTGETQQFGTQSPVTLHAGGVATVSPVLIPDTQDVQPDLEFGLLTDYTYDVFEGKDSHLSVYVNDLDDPLSPLAASDAPILFALDIPVIGTPTVQEMSMTLNLSEDLLVIIDENQPVRTDNALYVGPFSKFDPLAEGFDVLGVRHLQVFSDIVTACPWDCQDVPNGQVDVPDFLAILAQFGQAGTSCDFDGGGVSVTDFLEFLANFGPCPPAK